MKPGRKNLITDIPGILVGNAQDKELLSGCTVLRSTTLLTGGISIVAVSYTHLTLPTKRIV